MYEGDFSIHRIGPWILEILFIHFFIFYYMYWKMDT